MSNHQSRPWGMLTVVILVLGVLIMLTALQRHLIYFPSKGHTDELAGLASSLGLQAWYGENGVAIGWQSAAKRDADNRIIVFHGNAGYALDRHYFVAGLQSLENNWDVFLFEYPGYGARKGTMSEASFKAASTQALETLLGADSQPVFIVGESLGSGIASYLAASFPQQVAGLLLVTPFSSLPDVAAHHYPFLPVHTLMQERYDSMEALSQYHGPVAFLLAGRDEIVTTELGQQLYNSYAGPKWLQVVEHAGHNTLPYSPGEPWWRDASRFLTAPH